MLNEKFKLTIKLGNDAMREHASQFDCLYRVNKMPGIDSDASEDRAEIERWRDILANARGRYFSGYASELIAP